MGEVRGAASCARTSCCSVNASGDKGTEAARLPFFFPRRGREGATEYPVKSANVLMMMVRVPAGGVTRQKDTFVGGLVTNGEGWAGGGGSVDQDKEERETDRRSR